MYKQKANTINMDPLLTSNVKEKEKIIIFVCFLYFTHLQKSDIIHYAFMSNMHMYTVIYVLIYSHILLTN